jgi:uncharacterized coiled-coil protein SlyX
MTDNRIELEAKIAILERTIDALSGEMHQQAKTIQTLEAKVQTIAEQLKTKMSDSDLGPHNSPPPHYG